MALLSEMNAAIAKNLHYQLASVVNFSRVLREAGMLSQKGRGRGAAHATPLDGARTLIALLTTHTASKAVECVANFGALIYSGTGQTFENALTAVISGQVRPAGPGNYHLLEGYTAGGDFLVGHAIMATIDRRTFDITISIYSTISTTRSLGFEAITRIAAVITHLQAAE